MVNLEHCDVSRPLERDNLPIVVSHFVVRREDHLASIYDGVHGLLDLLLKTFALVAFERVVVAQALQPRLMQAWKRDVIDLRKPPALSSCRFLLWHRVPQYAVATNCHNRGSVVNFATFRTSFLSPSNDWLLVGSVPARGVVPTA